MSRRIGLILIVAAIALLAAGLVLYRYIPDDTFIALRYARNVAEGKGFVFNAGERVEGYTNFLWIVLLAAAGRLGLPLEPASRLLSLLCTIGVLALTARLAGERAEKEAAERAPAGAAASWPAAGGGASPSDAAGAELHSPAPVARWPAALLPVVILAAVPATATWALSGTEIPLYTLLLLAGLLQIEREAPAWRVFLPLGVLGLVRPDGLLFFAAAGLLLLSRKPRAEGPACAEPAERGRTVLAGLVVLVLLYAPYLLWKQRWFGELLPNTWYAKTGPPGLMIANGARYLLRFLFAAGWLVPAGLLLGGEGLRRRSRALLLFVLLHWGAVAALGGDWMPNFRLLLPTLPLGAILFAEGLLARTARYRAPGGVRPAATRPAGRRVPEPTGIAVFLACALLMVDAGLAWERFQVERLVVRSFGHVGRHLGETLPPRTLVACGSTGAIGWHSRLPIVDILGLTEPAIARGGRIVSTQPGHMKTNGRHVIDRRPDLLLLGNVWVHRGRRPERDLPLKIQERDIVDQPDFDRLYRYDEIPLGGGFFLSCYRLRSNSR